MFDGTEGEVARGALSELRTRPRVTDAADLAVPHETGTTGSGTAPMVGAPPRPEPTLRDGPKALRRTEPALPVADPARYRFGEVLGEGGMGEVVLAHDLQIGRDVAVKRIRTADPEAEEIARFLREARVQGRLEHPAIAPVHDLAVDAEGRPFFVMKRLTGTTMFELLDAVRSTSEAERAAVRRRMLHAFVDVCLAVEFAHSRGIIHRDLKPANIMLGDFGEVHVLDWGLARAVSEAEGTGQRSGARPVFGADLRLETGDTLVGTVMGTPGYMAPEQLAGGRTGPAADIYALGCILFEVTAGLPLHVRGRPASEPVTRRIPRPSVYRPEASPELDAICERATDRDPTLRFASARLLGDAVQAFLDGDRDLAARAALAQAHLAEARAALSTGDDEHHRRAAMQAAGRALALDPTAVGAVDLVTHLMLEPPREIPAEVERHLAVIDTESARHQGRVAAYAMLAYLCFVPVTLWTGVREPLFIVVYAVLAAVCFLHVLWLSRRPYIARGAIYLNACINALLIAVVTRMVGPFIITPALAIITLMGYAAHPRFGRISVMAIILGAAVAVPWALEVLGLVSSTYRFTADGELVLGSSILRFTAVPAQVALVLLLGVLLLLVALLSRGLAKRQRQTTRELELRAWHLRQVVPSVPR